MSFERFTPVEGGKTMRMERLSIVGLGLMGGSLGLAARRRGIARSVVGYARRAENRAQAEAAGAVEVAYADAVDAVRDADVVVLCLPVLAIPDMARRIRPALGTGTLVTDVGSTKASLVREVNEILADSPATFLGSHPIAGSDLAGIDAAKADLYQGATVLVTPTETTREEHIAVLRSLWEETGASVLTLAPEAHDRMMARTSHLPHLCAAMLVETVRRNDEDVRRFCGSGYRDTTRVAGGSAEIWHDIVKTNCEYLRGELDAFAAVLTDVRTMLGEEDFEALRAFLARAGKKRVELDRTAPKQNAQQDPE